ncbi:MAG: OB-fold putative lipoprotein [Gemmataceae bacterium]|nr:OB-fold putative lipoprotein [Gemmataceae bacterium]
MKVRGVWPEWSDEHRLDECELLETGPNPAVEIAAEALAEQFAKNKEATRAKFQDRFLLVTGILVDREVNETGAVRLWLKGAGDLRVDCGFDAPDRSEAERPPLGSGVRLVGEFSLLESHSAPALRGCRLITNPR